MPSDRAWLHERIEQRFRQMMNEGFLEEVRSLRASMKAHVAADLDMEDATFVSTVALQLNSMCPPM